VTFPDINKILTGDNMKFKEKVPAIEAHRWFKNGDHPLDACETFTGSDGKPFQGEGHVVRYYRRPDVPGDSSCPFCDVSMCKHGWIDFPPVGITVCPGNWVISVGISHYFAMPHERFLERYELVEE